VKMEVKERRRASDAGSFPLQCWAPARIYPPTKDPPSSNNNPNSSNHSSPRMAPPMSLHLPSTAKTSPSPTCFIFFNQNGASMNATATNGRSSALRCGCVARHYLILPFHSFTFLQARIALLEGERRSFENIKVDLMRRIKMLEYALRVERFVSILSSTASTALTRPPPLSSSKQLSQSSPHASQSIAPTKVTSLQSSSQKDETSSHKEASSPSSPRSEGTRVSPHSLLLLTLFKILPYPQKGDRMVHPPLVQQERQDRHHYLGGQTRMAQPQPQA
jgi:hypothetical protein